MTPERTSGRFVRRSPEDRFHDLGTWTCSISSVDEAVAGARATGAAWAATPVAARVRALRAVPDALDEVAARFASLISAEVGKPAWEARAEVQATLRQVDLLLSGAERLLAAEGGGDAPGTAVRAPVGVVAVLAPFPYPAFIPATQVVSALLAGNTVVLKPSSLSPGCGQLLAEAVGRARLPRGAFGMVQGPREPIGAALLQHTGVDRVVVSGRPSTARALAGIPGGRLVLRASARSTAAVLADAPVERAAFEVALGAFLASGQRCNGTARVCVSEGIAGAFLPALYAVASGLRTVVDVPEGRRDEAFLGPLAHEGDLHACIAWLDAVRTAGLPLPVEGGFRLSPRGGNHFAPAIYEASPGGVPGADGSVLDLVGPVLEVLVVPRDEDAVAEAASATSLSASVFTADDERFERARRALPQGVVNWNRATVVASGRLPASGPAAWAAPGEGHLDLMRVLTRVQAAMEGPVGAPSEAEFPPGVDWRPSSSRATPGARAAATGGPDSSAERAALVVARGQRARASFSDQS